MTIKTTPNFGLSYPESGDHTRTWEYWQTLATQVDTLLKDKFVQYSASGQIAVTAGGITRPVPFATQVGLNSVSLSQTVSATTAIVFSAGRFTQPPMVVATSADETLFASAYSPTTTGFTLAATHYNGQPLTGNYFSYWHAIQIAPGSGPGLLSENTNPSTDDVAPMTVTCHTTDCDNADIPITIKTKPDVGAIICSGCNQPITDHVPA
jgi:hypothetical protein